MGWSHAAGHPGLKCGVLAEPPRTSARLTGRKVSSARWEWLTGSRAYLTVERTQLMGTAAISFGFRGTQDPHHPLSTLQGHPAYLMPPRPGLGHLCCLHEPIRHPALQGSVCCPRPLLRSACLVLSASAFRVARTAACWCPEAPPEQGRVAFYAPSRVNRDWDGPFPPDFLCVFSADNRDPSVNKQEAKGLRGALREGD